MQQGKYQLYKHKRISSSQKPRPIIPQSPNNRSNAKFANSKSIQKEKDQKDEIETAESDTPNVSCKSGCVFNIDKEEFIWKVNSLEKREIASLTKIMTCWVVIQYIRQNKIIPEDQYLLVSKKAAEVGGTSADLCEGDKISIWDLLHGLMLPSGNDAALCLAEGLGNYFGEGRKQPLDAFVEQMNKQAVKYNMTHTNYTNPHGLSHKQHKSTCQDQILLIRQVLKDSIFRILIQKKLFFSNVEQKNGWSREMFWQTTNKLLHSGFNGIKTGSTPQAGPCLASWYNQDGYNILIVTLASSSADNRFKDSINIVKWIRDKNKPLDVQSQYLSK